MDLREVFAANLRCLRHAKGLSQADLAYEAEVIRSSLSQLEKGAFYASLRIVARIADALDVEPVELLRIPRERQNLLDRAIRIVLLSGCAIPCLAAIVRVSCVDLRLCRAS